MDRELNDRLRAGDRDAFAEIFDAHARTVHAYAVRLTGDWAAADDIMSLTFLEAWKRRGKLRDEVGDVRAWLLGVATNVSRNTARAARRHRAAMARLPPPEPLPDVSDGVVRQLHDTARLAAVTRAVRRLKRGDREVLGLVVWSELGYAEASAALGVPVGTVRSRLSRARQRLRLLVDEELAVEAPAVEPRRPSGRLLAGPAGPRLTRGRENG
ncbi:RNA polymerase sigma factor [Streptomyces sp. NPDC058052]|uniref:RNA polymerase sigma factor n=1 Tax=Streptomyces sp. NPDC058052 TaxID=3346316 RepID=UPI0036E73B3F